MYGKITLSGMRVRSDYFATLSMTQKNAEYNNSAFCFYIHKSKGDPPYEIKVY